MDACKINQTMAILLTITLSSAVSATHERYRGSGFQQCCKNQDNKHDRHVLLEKLDSTLKNSIPAYAQFPLRGFFVYDLNDPSNKYIPGQYAQADACISFIDNHVYHFAPVEFAFSESHVLVIEHGQLKIFKSINCKDSSEHLPDVIAYVEKRLKKDRKREELVSRIRNYRNYGFYMNTDSPRVECQADDSAVPDEPSSSGLALRRVSESSNLSRIARIPRFFSL